MIIMSSKSKKHDGGAGSLGIFKKMFLGLPHADFSTALNGKMEYEFKEDLIQAINKSPDCSPELPSLSNFACVPLYIISKSCQ